MLYKHFEENIFNDILRKSLNKKIITMNQYKLYLRQHDLSNIKFTDNGVGFYFDYHDIDDIDLNTSERKILDGGNYISKSHPEIIVEIILFIIDNNISCMEGQAYGSYINPIFFEDYVPI